MNEQAQYAGKVALLAIAYYITGMLGLSIAAPPGYATIIWPASGIALGALITYGSNLWPGILIGSFVLNAQISGIFSLSEGVTAEKISIAILIASGSTLQALVNREIIKTIIGLPINLKGIRDVINLFFLAGAVGCVIAASIGTTILYLSGKIEPDGYLHHWLTWWIGDVLGIIIFLPLVLVAPGMPGKVSWRGHQIGSLSTAAILILTLPLGLTFYLWKATSYYIYEKNKAQFELFVKENEKALTHRLQSYEQALNGAVGFFQGSSFVSRDEWRSYVDAINVKYNYPGISGLGWIAEVDDKNLEIFTEEVKKDGMPDFRIFPSGNYLGNYIITYLEPNEGNNYKVIGLNIAFDSSRFDAASLARDTGRAAMTKRVVLTQDTTKSPGFLLFMPVYKNGFPTETAAQRRVAFNGWIYAPFIARNFMKGLTSPQEDIFDLKVYDGIETEDALIYNSDTSNIKNDSPKFKIRHELNINQRSWILVWESTPEFENRSRSYEPSLVLAGGLVFTILFGAFLVSVGQRADIVEKLVKQRTAELVAIEAELKRSNKELEQFAYIASHDLQEPLRKIGGFTERIEQKLKGQLDEQTLTYMKFITSGVERMRDLIQGLLAYSRISTTEEKREIIDSNEIVKRAIENLSELIDENNAIIRFDNLPKVFFDKLMLGQIFQNLIGNAIKYKSEKPPEVNITAQKQENEWLFCVEDNGIGIEEKFVERIFILFQRLHRKEEVSGTGIGLSLCQKIIERYGGKIWVTSIPGEGSKFYFTILINGA